ncbi:MAG: respiratory nitrate reductase subunit gamma [Acidimicrobiales bacterium]
MTTDQFLFGAVPYVVAAVALIGTVWRWRRAPFSVSSLSSQLLESRKLYWGSVPFHWGLSLILVGHLVGLIIPQGLAAWNGASIRLYVAEITGLALAVWAGIGIVVLAYRRLTDARVRTVTTPMDLVVLAVVAVQIVTGIWVAVGYRWGSAWGPGVLGSYVRSLLVFQPDPAYVAPLPWVVKIHVLGFFVFLALFPFSRLIHIVTLPAQYLTRPWQRVVAMRRPPDPGYALPRRGRGG